MIYSLLASAVTAILSLVLNNFIIKIYGAEINGLVSTLTQFVSMFSILEGGFTTAALVATYEPIVKKRTDTLNDILYTIQRKMLYIGMVITAISLVAGSIYIFFLNTPLSYGRTYSLLLISVLNTSLSLCVMSKHSILLQGNNKQYIISLISLLTRIVTWFFSMVLILKGADIVLVYGTNLVNVIFTILLLKAYEKKKYPCITFSGKYVPSMIKGTNDVFLQKIASTVFSSTDLVLISVFINLASASIYNLYFSIFALISTILGAIIQSPFNSFGQMIHDEDGQAKLEKYFGIYQHMGIVVEGILLTITTVMIIPFAYVYTKDITEINYVSPILAMLLYTQIYFQMANRPFGVLLNVFGYFKMQNKQCVMSVFINILVSISFIRIWGIYSIVAGSIAGILIIVVLNIYQVYKYVISEKIFKLSLNICINYVLGLIIIMLIGVLNISINSYGQWIIMAVIVSVMVSLIYVLFSFIFEKEKTVNICIQIKEKLYAH